MSRAQWLAIACCAGTMVVDGYDTLAITLALPGIAAEWQVPPVELGGVVSVGLLGMALGALILGPVADMVGRRTTVLIALCMTAVGMCFSMFAQSIAALFAWRTLVGVGMGGLVAVSYALASEYANDRMRALTVSLLVIGFPTGGALGGSMAAALMAKHGWRSVFVPGVLFPGVVMVMALLWLHEPPGMMIERPRSRSLAAVNHYLAKVGQASIDRLPAPRHALHQPIRRLASRDLGRTTVLLSLIYSMSSCVAYFFVAWLPHIVTDRGFSPAQAASAAVAVNVGGVGGAIFAGLAISRFGSVAVMFAVLCGIVLAVIGVGLVTTNPLLFGALGALGGICIWGAIVAINVMMAESFPPSIRATGTGFVVGLSRWAAAVGPLLGGYLFGIGLGVPLSCAIAALPGLASAALLYRFHSRRRTAKRP